MEKWEVISTASCEGATAGPPHPPHISADDIKTVAVTPRVVRRTHFCFCKTAKDSSWSFLQSAFWKHKRFFGKSPIVRCFQPGMSVTVQWASSQEMIWKILCPLNRSPWPRPCPLDRWQAAISTWRRFFLSRMSAEFDLSRCHCHCVPVPVCTNVQWKLNLFILGWTCKSHAKNSTCERATFCIGNPSEFGTCKCVFQAKVLTNTCQLPTLLCSKKISKGNLWFDFLWVILPKKCPVYLHIQQQGCDGNTLMDSTFIRS